MTPNGLLPFVQGTWSSSKSQYYYWPEVGMYLYTDLNGDGIKDLYAFYLKDPWPTNAKGLNLFCEYVKSPAIYDLQSGLTQVRKCVLSDIDNDKLNEVILFSSGVDAIPFPGDSIGIFYPKKLLYEYLSDEIGYFHGGAAGDINNDGLNDIVAYSGSYPIRPVAYINSGNGKFRSVNEYFVGFGEQDNFYTVELFDINNDGKLDLLLGDKIIYQAAGIYNKLNAINLPLSDGLSVIDLAFFDFNEDGSFDILTMSVKENYIGYNLDVFINKGNTFTRATDEYIENNFGTGVNNWIAWVRLFDYDKDGDLVS